MGAGHIDDAIKQLENLLERSPNLPSEDRFRVNYFLGEANYLRGNVSAARDIFQRLSMKFGYDRQNTLFNWAICSLELGDTSSFEQAFRELEEQKPHEDLMGDLLFDKGLLQAKAGNGSADETLRRFIKQFPDHPQTAQAHLIQAEVRMTGQSPDLDGARKALSEVARTGDSADRRKSGSGQIFPRSVRPLPKRARGPSDGPGLSAKIS